MSSLPRRIRIRSLKRQFQKKRPIVADNGNILGFKWSVRPRQLFFLADLTPVFPETKHPTLQPAIDALAAG